MEPHLLANRYKLQHLLGRGGMAHVYYAYDTALHRPVALKILRPEYARDARLRQRFHHEATLAARFNHPNIVTVYDFGYDKDRLFIAMEYVPGKTLRHLIDTQAPLPPKEAIALLVQACAGIGYMHRLGLVHCDVKPQNMLLTANGHLKVTDFGIARAVATPGGGNHVAPAVWGSPQYFSPEQAAGLTPVPASDVYSLGVVLYELLTRHLPFLSDDPEELARMHRQTPPIPPHTYVPNLPEPLEQAILKTLAKEPAARYRTADQLGRILLRLATSSPAPQERPNAPQATTSLSPPRPAATGNPKDPIDWLTIGLAFFALIAIGGLVPLWVWVYLLYH